MPPPRLIDKLDCYNALVFAFCEFLTVSIHLLLYERNIYPRTSFKAVRKYNHAVRQSRHPKVCEWIRDAVEAVKIEMLKCTVAQTSLIIYSFSDLPLERYVFRTAAFPSVPKAQRYTPFLIPEPTGGPAPQQNAVQAGPSKGAGQAPQRPKNYKHTPIIDLHVQFAALLARLQTQSSKLAALPKGCSFTLAIELRSRDQGGQPPNDSSMTWIAARPGLQSPSSESSLGGSAVPQAASDQYSPWNVKDFVSPQGGDTETSDSASQQESSSPIGRSKKQQQKYVEGTAKNAFPRERGRFLGGARSTPVRTVEAEPFVMEVWVEETSLKFDATPSELGEASEAEEEE